MQYFVYILQSLKTGQFYKGLTDNVDRRVDEHKSGKCTSTKTKLPVKLVYVHICNGRTDARNWEKFFKSGIGREIVKELARL